MASGFEQLVRRRSRISAEDDNPDTRLIPGFGDLVPKKRYPRKRRRPRQNTPNLNRYPGFNGSNRQD